MFECSPGVHGAKHSKQREEHIQKYRAKTMWCIQGTTMVEYTAERLHEDTGFQIKSINPTTYQVSDLGQVI